MSVKTLQRLAGAVAGVALTGLLLALVLTHAVRELAACALAALVPASQSRSYLLYSIVSTPLILLVLDVGRPLVPALLVDRLVATFFGGAIVIALNLVFVRLPVAAMAAPEPATKVRCSLPGQQPQFELP